MRVLVLLSAGRDEFTGQPMRSQTDARALRMAMTLAPDCYKAVHVGQGDAPALGDYLGMGCPEIEVWSGEPETGLAASLARRLNNEAPELILMGQQAESGARSGMLPYALASVMGKPLVPSVTSMKLEAAQIRAQVPAPDGSYRVVSAPLPAIVTVSRDAPDPGPVVPAWRRNGRIFVTGSAATDPVPEPVLVRRKLRPRPLPVQTSARAWDRVRGVFGGSGQSGATVQVLDPPEAARLILSTLSDLGFGPQATTGKEPSSKPRAFGSVPLREKTHK